MTMILRYVIICNMESREKAQMLVYTSEQLKRQFKTACAADGVTLSEQVEKLIRAWLERRGSGDTGGSNDS